MAVRLREMRIEDHAAAIELWKESEGIGLSDADSHEGIDRYLRRNPGLSWVAFDAGELVGTVLSGHDGRRGYVHHLAVRASHRRQGVGRALVQAALEALKRQGLAKVHLFLFPRNEAGRVFWERLGWSLRHDLNVLSKNL